MEIKYITTEEIMRIHDRILEKSGGHAGIISKGNLEFAVTQAEIPKSLERKAATLFYGILTSHPFVDGNKRTALVATQTFLNENRREFLAADEDLWDVVHEVSTGKLKFEQVVIWIKKNLG